MKNHTMLFACSLITWLAFAGTTASAQRAEGELTLPDQWPSDEHEMLQQDIRSPDRLPLQFCSSRVAGSYLLSFQFSDGTFSSRGVLSLSKDGILVTNDSSQGGLASVWDPFTSGQGAWRCAGRISFHGVSINFNIPGEIDPNGGLARLDYEGSIDWNGRIYGTVELRFFEVHQDPWSDVVSPTDVFTFDGKRIEATDPK